jgi:ATP-dependent Lhr-like helicase
VARDPLALFTPEAAAWFRASLGTPTLAQARGWPPIAAGESTLLLAPTGSGKTLAAFLAAIDRLMSSKEPAKEARCRVLYVSPLKALAVDIEKNLRAPLAGIAEVARRAGHEVRLPTASLRTGDTPQTERLRMQRAPPDILITTPESLYLLLTSRARQMLASVETVIIDEIHSLAATKRGAHLFLSLERLEALRPPGARPLQRIGLSATQRPLDEIARLLGGFEVKPRPKRARGESPLIPRPVTIVDASARKELAIEVHVPAIDMAKLGELEDIPSGPAAGSGPRRSIWPHLHEHIVALVRAHRSTMIFVNSRRLAERLAGALNEVAGDEIALAHHGSVAREARAVIEDRLKRGELPAIVATSSLELGIDMGAVDLVIQVEAPPSVASGLQRIGRAGHSVGDTSRGVIFPKHRGDLLACAAAVADMRRGHVEETRYPRNPLDVLAQQIVAIASMGPIQERDLYALVRRAASFAELPRSLFDGVLDLLSGRYPSDDFAELRPRITWDRTGGTITARAGAQRLAVANAGTIPDRGLYGVFLAGGGDDARGRPVGKRVGELDEEMVFELREGEVFLLGASSWRAEQITHDRVLVSPAPGEPGKMPFWHGDRPGRPLAFGESIGALSRELAHAAPGPAAEILREKHGLDESAAQNLLAYLAEEIAASGEVPSDRLIIFQRFQDELGDWRVCILSPFGSRVHAPWATAVAERLKDEHPGDIEVVWSDDGMVFRIPSIDEPPPLDWFLVPPDEIEGRVTRALGQTSLFAAHFRECAGRALLLPRRRPGLRTPLWAQRKRASDLLGVAAQHPTFPILLETYRECLRDVFDLPGLVGLLTKIEQRRVLVRTVDVRAPSPFAASLLFSFAANFIYESDAPLAERRAQALTIDQAQLRELLGEAELRSLLDPDVIEEHALYLQRFTRPVKHADGLHDLLLSLGDLSREEIDARAVDGADVEEWLTELTKARRIYEVTLARDRRFVAIEDAGKLRDAIGLVPPRGTPRAFLEPARDPMGELVARYARTHVPFVPGDVAARFGVSVATVNAALRSLVARAKVEEGEFLPRGTSRELCDVEVLRALRQKSLARLRKAVEPVSAAAYARLLLEWQLAPRSGTDGLLDAIRQLEGCPIAATVLEQEVLPARVAGFRPWDLDHLCATGEVVWAGIEPLGSHDGRIALYTAEHEALLARVSTPAPGKLAEQVRELLSRRGAVFFAEIARVVGGFQGDVVNALWEMVWAGEVTNDTLAPVRSLLRSRDPKAGRGRPGARRATSHGAAGTEGRWSLRASRWAAVPSETERRAALGRTFLARYGVVTREAVQAEGIVGGFGAVYGVLKAMEQAGRVRRGYFVAGHGATQFALAGADDRLRAVREPADPPRTRILAASDPANPYGASISWPAALVNPAGVDGPETGRPQRATGAYVVLHEGSLVGWLGRSGQTLLTFGAEGAALETALATALALALAGLVESARKRALLLVTIDGEAAARSVHVPAFQAAGFTLGTRGLLRRRAEASFLPPAAVMER